MIRECTTKQDMSCTEHNLAVSAVIKTSVGQSTTVRRNLSSLRNILFTSLNQLPKQTHDVISCLKVICGHRIKFMISSLSYWATKVPSTDEPKLSHLRYLSSSVFIQITMLQPWSRFSHLETEQIQEKVFFQDLFYLFNAYEVWGEGAM